MINCFDDQFLCARFKWFLGIFKWFKAFLGISHMIPSWTASVVDLINGAQKLAEPENISDSDSDWTP